MGAIANSMIMVVAAILFSTLTHRDSFAQTRTLGSSASSDGNGGQFIGFAQTTTVDCAGGLVQIFGNNNKLALTGDCTGLGIFGFGNTITIQFGKGASIEVVGSNNTITWATPDGKDPAVHHRGFGNTLTRGL
jgi:hypothetical protein